MIRPRGVILAALIALATVSPAAAQRPDAASSDALAQALQILLDPNARSGELATNPQGSAVDRQVRALAGSEALAQELYALAGQVMTELVQSTGGDTQRMLAAVERAKADPAGFAAMLSPATQQRLRDLSVKLSDSRR